MGLFQTLIMLLPASRFSQFWSQIWHKGLIHHTLQSSLDNSHIWTRKLFRSHINSISNNTWWKKSSQPLFRKLLRYKTNLNVFPKMYYDWCNVPLGVVCLVVLSVVSFALRHFASISISWLYRWDSTSCCSESGRVKLRFLWLFAPEPIGQLSFFSKDLTMFIFNFIACRS